MALAEAGFTESGTKQRRFAELAYGARDLYERLYCARGEMENRIKEEQLHLFADRISCHRRWPNQFRFVDLEKIVAIFTDEAVPLGKQPMSIDVPGVYLTLFDSTGIVIQDLATVPLEYQGAIEGGVGMEKKMIST